MGKPGGGKLGHVQLAQEDGAGSLELGHDRRVLVGDEVVEDRRTTGGANTLGVELVFHCYWHTVHRPEIGALGDALLRFVGGLEGRVAADGEKGAESVIEPVDAFQIPVGNLNRGDVFPLDQSCKLSDG